MTAAKGPGAAARAHVIPHRRGMLRRSVWALGAARAAVRGPRWVSTLRKIDADADAAREVPTPLLFVAAPAWTGGKDARTYVGAH